MAGVHPPRQAAQRDGHGGGLAYRTIFATVPVIVLGFLILKAAGVVDNSRVALHQMLEQAGLTQIKMPPPAEGPTYHRAGRRG